MAVSSYTTIKAAIADWLARSDLTAAIDDFIDLTEARIYSDPELRLRFMETALSVTISSGVAALPSDFLALKHANISGSPTQWLDIKPAQWIYMHYPLRASEAKPIYVAVDGGNLIFGPYPDSGYTVNGIYYAKATALSASNETNYWTNNAPGLILFGALVESGPYIGDDSRLPMWEAKYQQIRTQLIEQEAREKFPKGSTLATTTA